MHHVHHTINGSRGRALDTIKGEIPSSAAIVAVVDSKIAIPEDTQSSFVRLFVENTFLQEGIKKSILVHITFVSEIESC